MSTQGPSSWARALDAFDAVVDLQEAERAKALASLALESPELAMQVRGLLAADAGAEAAVNAEPGVEAHAAGPENVNALANGEDGGGDGVASDRSTRASDDQTSNWPRVPGFRVLGELGHGGMGEVFLAERETDQFVQRVALKRMSLGRADASLRERFLRERRILAQLNHPNIARLLDGGLDADGNPYFAMEYVEGTSLTRHAQEHALGLRARLTIFIVVCEAVAHAHQNLVVHRDLKPSNVMVDTHGDVKLLDFGIAKLLAGADDEATLTLAMTPTYAAPEQLLGEPVSTATDVYALGVMLYELLVGHLPERSLRERIREAVVEQNSMERPSAGVLTGPPPSPVAEVGELRQRRRLANALRGDLDQIVLLALRRDPTRRYASAQALADDLRRHLNGRPVRACADHWQYRLGKFLRRNAWASAAALAAASGLIVATLVSLNYARSERAARDAAEVAVAATEVERLRAQQGAERATRTKDFVVALISDVDPLTAAGGKGDDYSAVELLDAAALRVEKDLADAPHAQAELRHAIAASLNHLGRSAAALPLLEAAIPQLRSLGTDGRNVLSQALQTRSQVHEQLGDMTAAEPDAREALALALTLPDSSDVRLTRIQIRTTLAKQLTLRDQLEESLVQYQGILADRTALLGGNADSPDLAVDWNNLAVVYDGLQRFADAESAARRAMQLFAAGNGNGHPRMAWLHTALGYALIGQLRLDEAQAELGKSRAIALEKLGPRSPILINTLIGIGRVETLRGRPAQAEAAFLEAVEIATALDHVLLGHAEMNLGISLMEQGRAAESNRVLSRGIARARAAKNSPPNPFELRATVAHGVALARLGRATEGKMMANEALMQLATAIGTDTPRYKEAQHMFATLQQDPPTD